MKNKALLVIIIAVVVVGGGVVAFSLLLKSSPATNLTDTMSNAINGNLPNGENVNGNTNLDISISTNAEATYTGKVFIKGYKTPSESFGILTDEGYEVGFGDYDTMKEQFRPYTGERISVTFQNICRSSQESCCRTLFYYCGTPKIWKPLE